MTRGFVYQSSYRIETEGSAKCPVVHLFGRLENGDTFLVRDDRDVPTFYVRRQDEARARRLGAEPLAATDLRTLGDGDEALRVEVPVPPDTPPLRDRLHGMGIPTWEADVRFAMRHLMQRGIRGGVAIHGEAKPGPFADQGGARWLYVNPELRPGDWVPEPRVLSLDIETDPKHRRLLSIALYGCGAAEVLLLTPPGQRFDGTVACPEGAIPCRDARELLQRFAQRVRELDPDVLTGWSVVDFDLTVLADAAQHLGVPLELGRAPGALQVKPGRSRFEPSQVRLPGRVVLDGPALLRGAFVRMERYSLDFVAREVLGEGKLFTDTPAKGGSRVDEILRTFEHDRERFVAYNLKDARLVIDILERLGLVRLAVQRSLLTGMPMDRVSSSVAAFDFLYMTALHRRGWVAPSVGAPLSLAGESLVGAASPWSDEPSDADEDFAADMDADDEDGGRAASDTSRGATTVTTGGYVLEPEPGLYRYVLVLDFQSLYPSLIRTFHIDPAGSLRSPTPEDDPVVAPNGAAFRRGGGILPALLDDLMPRRQAAKQAGDKVASQAIKILMNSFYGVLGTSSCRFHNPDIANAITSFGRELLLWSKARIEGYGYRVLYGDTDSLFVATGVEEPDEAKGATEARQLGRDIATRLTSDLADHVEATWRVESRLQMEFEHLYLRLLLPSMRGSSAGARKRYAGLAQDEDGGEPTVVFTGMEVVRRDWTDLAREVQRQLYERLFHDRPVDDYLARVVEQLRAGEHDAELIYRKSLRKDLSEYAASSPQVVAARKLRRKPGRRISYVITKRGPEPVDEQTAVEPRIPDQLDHEHYVEKQIRPVAEPVLEQLGLDFAKVIGDDRQLELF